jgi:hypothetical protein
MSDPTNSAAVPSPAAVEEIVLVTTNTRELDEDESSAPLSPSKRATNPLPIGAGKAKKTQDNYQTGLKYINWFLEEQNLPLFDNLNHKDVEADHLQNFIDNNMHWMVVTQFKTPMGWLDIVSKVKYFSHIKMVWQHKFPKSDLWKNETYWTELSCLTSGQTVDAVAWLILLWKR